MQTNLFTLSSDACDVLSVKWNVKHSNYIEFYRLRERSICPDETEASAQPVSE